MNNKRLAPLAVAVLVGVTLIALLMIPGTKPAYPIKRNIRYSFTLQNKTNQLQKEVEFRVFAPVKQTSFQKTVKITATDPYELQQDELSNQILYFNIDKLPPFATHIITISAEIDLATQPNPQPLNNKEIYLSAEPYMQTNDQRLIELSNRLTKTATTDSQKADKLYQWVNNNLKYAGYTKEDRGALYALKNRKGDCTEYMYLYSSLTRIAGLATRGIGGYVYSEDAVLKPEDFHNWSEVYVDGSWRIIDPQNGSFMEDESHFIAMRIISRNLDDKLKLKNTHQFAIGTPNVQVRMN